MRQTRAYSALSAVRTFVVTSRRGGWGGGGGGHRRASSSRGVGRSSPNRLLGGIPSAEVDVGPYIYIIKKSTKRRVFIPFPPSVIYIL